MEKQGLYSRITNRIILELEKGCRPWLKPWNAEHTNGRITRPLRENGVPYRGINVVNLWMAATANGYACPTWMTYNQAHQLGGQVRKGERGELVVYASKFSCIETEESGAQVDRDIPFLKAYTVFNAEQIDGLSAKHLELTPPILDPLSRMPTAESFFENTKADIRHGGNQAFYAVHPDYVQLPPFETFCDPQSYYATLAHECVHWTRHDTRLAREFGRKRWGDEGYAAEELVAELGSAFLCADLGLSLEPRPDHASYIENWLKVLRQDARAIFTAAAHAERAAAFLHGLQPTIEAALAAQEVGANELRAC